ncbi:phosphotransferase family protein [Nocardiopsis composta]|uniref:Aminoglycoside phosphotransferase (APT) family kinase protein n=1 Tax=Nocardiopsis composta TaxID=157465 RepID=A0A7W8VEU6_9ACTN|nr:aminoglycoside phosphotransferase family protein [Nocardiopsis composta]MBB5433299.1 aminoglycoside phosphotransferase (APT) family kinase protein [Nocardiopsis composta]
MEFSGGWDSKAVLVDGRWVERRPRRPSSAELLRREASLMPWLAPRLPLPVPVPEIIGADPLVVRHEFVPGEPLDESGEASASIGHRLGLFLRALHEAPADEAVRHGLQPAGEARREHGELIGRFRTEVVPLLPADRRPTASAFLETASDPPFDTVVHGDLGPEHVLADGGAPTGVIDFGDAHAGDRAIDLAWALNGTAPPFARAVAAAYGPSDGDRARALVWHRLGPWHEVLHGIDTGTPAYVRSGLDGVLDRLADGHPAA